MSFELDYSKSSKKFLKNSEKELSFRILDKLEILKENPVPTDAKRMQGKDQIFRIRIGKCRVLYHINHNEKIILISKIDKRERVYD